MHWRRKWQPTSVFLPRESQGRGSLVGCHLWGRTESETHEATQQQQQLSNHLNLCHHLLLLLSIFPSITVFSNESVLLIWWPKNWRFSNSPSNEHSRLISLRIDWFDIFAVQRILKGLLQSYNLKLSILQPLALFMIQLSHLYMTTRKTISSVQFSHSVLSDSLRPHESQHARPPCPSQTPGVYANSCPSSR